MARQATNVIPLKLRQRQRQKNSTKMYEHDSIFFTKDQLSVGVVLMHVGRKSPSSWVIDRIISHPPGKVRAISVREVQYLSDRVYLRRANGKTGMAERSATFGYLSYSAIWRIG